MISLDAARRVLVTVSCADADGASSFEWLPWIGLVRRSIILSDTKSLTSSSMQCWSVAARTFIKALAVKQAWGDTFGAPELRANIEYIIKAIDSYHTIHSGAFAILLSQRPQSEHSARTDNIAKVLQNLLDNVAVGDFELKK